ncbi:hypothetical protein O6H91_08G064600 [Diphasiastrum complanatum]|uniref:Uncharacterized protein n=1 Tax=Diphasiastrum complanatum TaxID=34168 RepID=A0ACC2CYA4_DIPCM|nr:hypothetical protein O6H91_08G064600 [Diphasiastrum complanatum]
MAVEAMEQPERQIYGSASYSGSALANQRWGICNQPTNRNLSSCFVRIFQLYSGRGFTSGSLCPTVYVQRFGSDGATSILCSSNSTILLIAGAHDMVDLLFTVIVCSGAAAWALFSSFTLPSLCDEQQTVFQNRLTLIRQEKTRNL